MLKDSKAISGFSVSDVTQAAAFYRDTLGLDATVENDILHIRLAGGGHVIAYPKGGGHVPATFTVLNFPVDDIEQAVDDLVGRGVTFARYDGMKQDERGIMREGGPYIAWFTDPSGNILSVLQER
jgi:catechol 2,3-dioxygenase-like lactoylglutathione lyase family enzyme